VAINQDFSPDEKAIVLCEANVEKRRVRGKRVSILTQPDIIKGKNFSLTLILSLSPQAKYFYSFKVKCTARERKAQSLISEL
jgi:hypothetical protein